MRLSRIQTDLQLWPLARQLEGYARGKLYGSGKIKLVPYLPETRRSQIDVGLCKLGVVEDVKDVACKLELRLFRQIEHLAEGHIPVVFALRLHLGIDTRFVSK